MKEFFKFTLATITGIIVSSVVLFFVSILILFSMLSSSESETQVRKNSVMMLDMRGMLSERSQDNPFDIFLSEDETTYGLDDILSSIQKAKENENIKGIYLQAGSMGIGFASLEEIRKALADFKTSGKFVVAYGDQYSQRLYYLASVGIGTDNPQNKLDVNGIIRAKEILVESNWADFVFKQNYKLLTLREVEEHIKEKGTLPNVPSEEEIKANGISLGKTNALLLQKIEELTLYVIQQQKEIEELKLKKLDKNR